MLSQVLRGTLADFGFANRDLVQVSLAHWLSPALSGSLRLSLALSGSLRLSLALSGSLWLSLAVFGSLRLSLALSGSLWLSPCAPPCALCHALFVTVLLVHRASRCARDCPCALSAITMTSIGPGVISSSTHINDAIQVRASDTALFVMTLMRDNQIFSIPVIDDQTGALLAIAQGKDIVRYRSPTLRLCRRKVFYQ